MANPITLDTLKGYTLKMTAGEIAMAIEYMRLQERFDELDDQACEAIERGDEEAKREAFDAQEDVQNTMRERFNDLMYHRQIGRTGAYDVIEITREIIEFAISTGYVKR